MSTTTVAPARLAGPWELGDRLGGGGQATVYRARHAERGTVAAVKVVHPDLWSDPGFRVRFRRECEALGSLRHPAVVPILDRGESEVSRKPPRPCCSSAAGVTTSLPAPQRRSG